MSRIVISGLGAITPLGNEPAVFWENLKAGRSGARTIEADNKSEFAVPFACLVEDFDPEDWLDPKQIRRTSRGAQLALAAARQAVTDSGLAIDETDASRVGVIFNTGGGGYAAVAEGERSRLERGLRRVSPHMAPNAMANLSACLVSIELGLQGPVCASTLACASGNYALLDAYYHLKRGDADVIVAGGTESAIEPVVFAAFSRMRALSTAADPQAASRPFDRNRDGFVFAEGAGAFVVETEEHARDRGAPIYAEILGGALTGDAHHLTAPHPSGRGPALAMRRALAAAGKTQADVDVIFAHATSTPVGDVAETVAIKEVFGKRAYEIPVTATKSQLGHTLGAAGALSSLAAVYSIQENVLSPTINYQTPDPDCDLDYVPNQARSHPVRTAMINAFGFGGQNVALLLGEV